MRQWAIGGVLVTIGLFGLVGSVTGFLPAMLAAMFDPTDLKGATKDGGALGLSGPQSQFIFGPLGSQILKGIGVG